MLESIAHIGSALLAARKKKGLTQRQLMSKTGVPQSHISKIENGEIDLQTSSLIELSRVLDLELMLVPRELIPVFKLLLRRAKSGKTGQVPLYQLEEEEGVDV